MKLAIGRCEAGIQFRKVSVLAEMDLSRSNQFKDVISPPRPRTQNLEQRSVPKFVRLETEIDKAWFENFKAVWLDVIEVNDLKLGKFARNDVQL